MVQVFLTADLHFNHTNIITSENRPFLNKEEMNLTLIDNWNKTVGKFDHVYVLGDFAFGSCEEILKQLKGFKILVMGNHDDRKSTKYWLKQGFNEVVKYPIIYDNKYVFSHRPIWESMGYFKNCCAHKHSKGISDANHFFVSVELTDYKPVNIKLIDKYFSKFKGDAL